MYSVRKRNLLRIAMLAVAAQTCASTFSIAVQAAEFFRKTPTSPILLLYGEIKVGDLDKIKAEVDRSFLSTIDIFSPGGDVYEAMRISDYLNEKMIYVDAPSAAQVITGTNGSTHTIYGIGCNSWDKKLFGMQVPPQYCICNSACSIIWMSAPLRYNKVAYRSFSGVPAIGVHRPHFDHAYFSGLDTTSAEDKYNEMVSQVGAYLKKNNVPDEVISKMMSTPSSEISILPNELANSVGTAKPYISELLTSRCSQYQDDLNELMQRANRIDYLTQKAEVNQLTDDELREYEKATDHPDFVDHPYEWCIRNETKRIQSEAQGRPFKESNFFDQFDKKQDGSQLPPGFKLDAPDNTTPKDNSELSDEDIWGKTFPPASTANKSGMFDDLTPQPKAP